MICSRFRSENPEGNRFCEQCGVALEARCAAWPRVQAALEEAERLRSA
jgi:hypothetical protein